MREAELVFRISYLVKREGRTTIAAHSSWFQRRKKPSLKSGNGFSRGTSIRSSDNGSAQGSLAQLLPVVYQIINHGRISQGGRVTEVTERFRGDVSQNAAHNLAGSGFGQTVGPLNLVG